MFPRRSPLIRFQVSHWKPVILVLLLSLLLVIPFHSIASAGYLNLTWNPPTTNLNGSPITDLVGYRLYSSTSSAPCPGSSFVTVPSGTSAPSAGTAVSFQLTGLVAGTTYAVQVTAVDSSGYESGCSNVASGPAQGDGSDTTPPNGSLSLNNGTGVTAWTAITVGLTATDNVGVTGYYLATSATRPAATATGWVAVGPTPSYSNSNVPYTLASGDGSKTVYAWYKDAGGNVSATAWATILLDQTPPSNGTLSASAGTGQVSLSWAGFTDGGSGLASSNPYQLVFSTGGSPASSCASGTQLLRGSATSFTHTGLTSGTTYYYRVCVFDNAGNVSTGAIASATPQGTDTTAPNITITSPTTSASYSTSSNALTMAGTASDNVGVTQVTWVNNLGGSGTASGTTSWTANGIALQSGSNVLTVTAKDAAGNMRTASLTVTYTPPDTTPPTVTITSPTTSASYSTSSSLLTVAGTASDNVGVTQVTWVNNLGGSGTASGTTSWTANGIALQSGSNVLTVTAKDAAGNMRTASLTVTYTPPSTAPTSSTAPTGLAIDAIASGDQGAVSRTVTTPGFSTKSGNELLLAFIAADYQRSSSARVSGVSGGGLPWVLVARTSVQSGSSEIWRAFAPAPLSNVTVTVTFSQKAIGSVTVVSFAGMDPSGTNGSGAIGSIGSGNDTQGGPTATLTTTRNGSWVFGVGNDQDQAIARTPGANQILVHQYLTAKGNTNWVQGLTAPTPTAGTRVTVNDTAPTMNSYNLTIVEVLPTLGP